MYILKCADGTFYVGSTWDLPTRLEQHASGHGGDYTSKRLPVELAFAAEFDRIDEAYVLEKRVQGWSHAKRQALIDGRLGDLPGLSSRRRPREVRVFRGRRRG
jgi:putative endonuclease